MLKKHLIIENHWKAKIVLKLLWLFILIEGATGFLGEGRRKGIKKQAFPLVGEDSYLKNESYIFIKVVEFNHFRMSKLSRGIIAKDDIKGTANAPIAPKNINTPYFLRYRNPISYDSFLFLI